jgi:site-specific DNA-methyltransferase (adenine-specific)
LVQSEALDLLSEVQDETADIVFLDPPFNLGKKYGAEGRKADLLPESEYLTFMRSLLSRAIEILKPGGALYLYHLPRWAFQFANLLHERLLFRHWIAVSMKNGFVRGQSLYPAHYALLYFTKGRPLSFSRPKTAPARCRHCKKYIKDYGGYTQHVEGGINLSDVWDDLSPVRHQKYKTRKANELPLELPRRVLTMSGRSGGVFVDPFAGAGTTLLAARESQMLFVAGDRDQESFDLIVQRLSDPTDSKALN